MKRHSMPIAAVLAAAAALTAMLPSVAVAQRKEAAAGKGFYNATDKQVDKSHRQKARKLISGGAKYLVDQKLKGGGWSVMPQYGADPAITAIVLKALLQSPDFNSQSPVVKEGFQVLLGFKQNNGGIYNPRAGHQNYTTAVAVMALAAAKDPGYKQHIDDAIGYLRKLQIVPGAESPDGKKITREHPFAGGVSYGKHGRPDLSNVSFWMAAMHEAGVPADDPAMQRALLFVTRTQNLSETNDRPFAKIGVNDGGFVYAPAIASDIAEPESKAGRAGKGWRSYGSMTYTGFKSLLYAGVDKDDPRVKAAFAWIKQHWRLDSNPNMPHTQSLQGLYYYYHAFAKALRAYGQDVIRDSKGKKHNWREELVDAIAKRVKKDGSWDNKEPRWMEGHPVLVTSFAMLSLQESLRK